MAVENIRLYEELKKTLSEEAARMIAEVVPRAKDLATKADIQRLETRLLRWTLAFFAPLWIAVLATLVALVLKA